jgi:hypothetical protein
MKKVDLLRLAVDTTSKLNEAETRLMAAALFGGMVGFLIGFGF